MRLTDFWERMARRFGGAYADSVARDHVFAALESRTIHQALDAGEDPKRVWRVVCAEFEVPAQEH